MTATDRRSSQRWDAEGAVVAWMFEDYGEPVRCRVVDASRNGVLLETPVYLLPGATIQLAFARGRGANVTRLFRSWAQVARRTSRGLAVFFVNPPQNARAPRQSRQS